MKQNISVLRLFARSSFPAFAVIVALGAAVQFLLFRGALQPGMLASAVADQSHISLVFLVMFLLTTVLLILPGSAFSTHTEYTVRRLGMSETRYFILQALYNAGVYFILLASELFITLGLIAYFKAHAAPSLWGPQEAVMTFYRSPFLHALLPMADWGKTLANILAVLSLGTLAALYPREKREGRNPVLIFVAALFTCITFRQRMGQSYTAVFLAAGLVVMAAASTILSFSEEGNQDA